MPYHYKDYGKLIKKIMMTRLKSQRNYTYVSGVTLADLLFRIFITSVTRVIGLAGVETISFVAINLDSVCTGRAMTPCGKLVDIFPMFGCGVFVDCTVGFKQFASFLGIATAAIGLDGLVDGVFEFNVCMDSAGALSGFGASAKSSGISGLEALTFVACAGSSECGIVLFLFWSLFTASFKFNVIFGKFGKSIIDRLPSGCFSFFDDSSMVLAMAGDRDFLCLIDDKSRLRRQSASSDSS